MGHCYVHVTALVLCGAGLLSLANSALAESEPVKANVIKASQFNIPSLTTAEHPGIANAVNASPTTYPDEAGFQKRVDILIAGLATNDLATWRKGYFTGGDPGKYTHGPIMAKLVLNPEAPDALAMQNDNRSATEQYHFACVNWSRFLPLFGSTLTDPTRALLDRSAGKYGYIGQKGTENHQVMWLTSACVLPYYTTSGRLQNMGKEAALAAGKKALQYYVKGLYAGGQGEWDSATYVVFDINGMLNIYDFSHDPECRLLAKAALDFYTTAYALKYTDGVYAAPNQRGFAGGPAQSIADQTGWLWWGSNAQIAPEQTKGFRYAMHAATSGYRPNRVITDIATRHLPTLPFQSNNTKPSYWQTTGTPQAGAWQETVYVSKHSTMGSLQRGAGGQTTRLSVVASSPAGGEVFTAGSPIGRNDGDGSLQFDKFDDGNGLFDQIAQSGGTLVLLSKAPAAEWIKDFAAKWAEKTGKPSPAEVWSTSAAGCRYVFFSYPSDAKPAAAGEWSICQAGDTYVAVRGIGARAEASTTPADKKGNTSPLLKFAGDKVGIVIETADTTQFKTLADFTAALDRVTLDSTKFADVMAVAYTTLAGRHLQMQYRDSAPSAAITIDGKALADPTDAPIYDGPYIHQQGGILTVNNGKEGFTVDFTGELPVYKAWTK